MNYQVQGNELYHHGILGQKWGVRRYQNPDGSLTEEGKKRYSQMSTVKLRKELIKNIRETRKKQGQPRYVWTSTIGPNSKKALDKWQKDSKDHQNDPEFKKLERKLSILENTWDNYDPDEAEAKWNKLWDDYYKTDSGKKHLQLTAVTVYSNNGPQSPIEYVKSYGKDITIGYLLDLGYDKAGAEYIESLLSKDLRTIGF